LKVLLETQETSAYARDFRDCFDAIKEKEEKSVVKIEEEALNYLMKEMTKLISMRVLA
jgi:hypothetical protein